MAHPDARRDAIEHSFFAFTPAFCGMAEMAGIAAGSTRSRMARIGHYLHHVIESYRLNGVFPNRDGARSSGNSRSCVLTPMPRRDGLLIGNDVRPLIFEGFRQLKRSERSGLWLANM